MKLRILATLAILLLFTSSTALACPDAPLSGCCEDDCEGSAPDMLKGCCTFADELIVPGPAVDMPSPTAIPGSPYIIRHADDRDAKPPSTSPDPAPRTRLFLTHQALLL